MQTNAIENDTFECKTLKAKRNPFIGLMMMDIQLKDKSIMRAQTGVTIDPDTGEEIASNTFTHLTKPMEKKRFIKTFAAFWENHKLITRTASDVLSVLMEDYNDSRFSDRIYMSHRAAKQEFDYPKTYRTWLKGINELIDQKFIARDPLETNWYFVNGCFLFKGDRWSYLQETIKEQ